MARVNIGTCAYCFGHRWLVRMVERPVFVGGKACKKSEPYIHQCPMCNPFGKVPPMVVDKRQVENLIAQRQKAVKAGGNGAE